MALQLKDCEVLSIISGTGAAICPAVVVKWCNNEYIVLACLASRHTKFCLARWTSCSFYDLLFGVMYLASCNLWQQIRSNSTSTFARSFVRSPLTMQPSCPWLLLVTRVAFKVMTMRQSSPLNVKVQTHWEQSQEHAHNFIWYLYLFSK
jgi:hypothetical protein